MNEFLWLVGRGTGIAALVLLSVSVAIGILTARRWGSHETPRFAVAEIHRRASLGATLLIVVHLATLVLDSEAGLRWLDVVVPFAASSNALWYGLGTIAVELLGVVVVTSLLRKRMPFAVWRSLHWLAYGMWPVAFAHSLGSGSDVGSPWMASVSVACAGLVAVAVGYRVVAPRAGAVRVDGNGRSWESVP